MSCRLGELRIRPAPTSLCPTNLLRRSYTYIERAAKPTLEFVRAWQDNGTPFGCLTDRVVLSLTSKRRVQKTQVIELERKQGVASEPAILVGVLLPDEKLNEEPLEELAGLAQSAGAEVVGRLVQKRIRPDVTTYIGKGKLEQLATLIGATHADLVIFDNDLSPGQTRNLERSLDVKVLDR